jgi:ComF family protein
MVHLLKYERKTHLSHRLGIFLANVLLADTELSSSSAIIPVPLHPARTRERGYNQSLLLARTVADATHRELIEKAVIRTKATKSQTALAHAERVMNLRNAFRVVRGDALKGKVVTVIDDVFTSGTTLNEMAKTLLDAGTEHVFGLVLARALST